MKNLLILMGFILLNLGIRWVSIWGPPLDDDEGIYLLMGRFILEGHLPYVHYWDHQPPLIYYLSAFAQLFSHENGLAGVRIIAAIFTGTTAWILFCLYRILFQSFPYAVFCGIVYSIWIYSPELKGWAYNNEILFNAFTSGSLLILFVYFKNSRRKFLIFLAGLSMGMGFLTKQNVIFDCIPFMFLIALFQPSFVSTLKRFLWYGAGCILPHALFGLWYAFHGELSLYTFANLQANLGYIEYEKGNYEHLNYLLNQLRFYIPFIPLVLFAHFPGNLVLKIRLLRIFFYFWLFFVMYGTTVSKTYYQHYFLQIFPCLSIMSVSLLQKVSFKKNLLSFFMSLFLYLLLIYSSFPLKTGIKSYGDCENEAAEYINLHKQPGDTLYVFDGDVILYYWTKMPILSRYAFPIHLIKEKFSGAFRIDQKKEFISILEKNPTWIVEDAGQYTSYRDCDIAGSWGAFYSKLHRDYSLVHTIANKERYQYDIRIYKRNQE